jgi:hypothetical protein
LRSLPTAALAALLSAAPALAQAPQAVGDESTASELPGGDIFGFTSPTDVGAPGDRAVAAETTIRTGKPGGGRYVAVGTKYQVGFTPVENVGLALSAFTAGHRIADVPDLEDRRRFAFDGLSGEALFRVLPRNADGVAATIAIEPRWSRIDGLGGTDVEGFGAEAKLFVDAVLIPGRLYGAFNLNFAPGVSRASRAGSAWERASGTNVSSALAYQLTDKVFTGVEARFLSSFDGAFLNRNTGNALFFGPNVLFKLGESAALNLAWTPQLTGRARGVDRDLDLDNFERHQVRVKFATAF